MQKKAIKAQGNSAPQQEVWMINQYAITPDLPGGTRHYDFGCELAKAGYLVRIFASDVNLALRKHTKLQDGQLWREDVVNGVHFVWVRAAIYQVNDWRRVWNMLTFTFNVVRVGLYFKHAGARPRSIIGSSPHPFAALSAWALAKAHRARFILELRDLWPQALVDMGGLSERSPVVKGMRLLERFLYRVAEKIIILAPGSERYLVQKGVPKEKLVYIPNGVHLGNFQGIPQVMNDLRGDMEADRARGSATPAAFTVMYTGAHGPANSLETVLEAARLLEDRRDIRMVLVGDGPSKRELIQKAKALRLTNVQFMDPVPKNQIPNLLASADATLITLRAAEAFSYAVSPNKLFDYMAAGRPVLCAVPGDMARLVEESGAGVAVEPENPEALARAVKRLADSPVEEREDMGRRGRAFVEAHYSREKLAQRLAEIL